MGKKNKEIRYNILSKLYFANIIVLIAIFSIVICGISWQYQNIKDEILYSNVYFKNFISSHNETIHTEFGIVEKYIENQNDVFLTFKYALGKSDKYDNWYLLDSIGKPIFVAVDEPNNDIFAFFKNQPWQNENYAANGIYVSKFDMSNIHNPVRFMMKKLEDGRILVAKVKYDFLLKELIKQNKKLNVNNLVTSLDGKILFAADTKLMLSQKSIVDGYSLKPDFIHSRDIHLSKIGDESMDLFLFAYVDNEKVGVVTSYPLLKVFKNSIYIIIIGLVIVLLSVLVVFTNIRFAKNQILRPIEVARSIIRRIHRGEEITKYVDSGYINELGDIIRGTIQIYLETEKKRSIYLEYENKFGYLFEQGPFIILLLDAKTGSIIEVSQKAVEFYGFSKDEFLTKTFYDLTQIRLYGSNVVSSNSDDILWYETIHQVSSGELKNVRVSIKNIKVDDNLKYGFCVIEDITREKKLIQNLEQENEKDSHSPILSLMWGLGMFKHISSVSPNVKNFLGYTVEEVLDSTFNLNKIIYHEDLSSFTSEINIKLKFFEQTKRQKFEPLKPYRILRKNGDVVLCNIFIKLLSKDGINVDSVIAYIIDTELIPQNLNLQSSNLDTLTNFDWEFGFAKNSLVYNENLMKYLGYDNKNTPATPFDCIHKDDLQNFNLILNDIKNNIRKDINLQIRLTKFNGEEIWFDVILSEIKNDDFAKPAFIKGFLRDVNYKRVADKYKNIVKNLFAYSNEAIAVVSSDGKFIDVNDIFCKTTGYRKEEVVGKTPSILKSGIHDSVFYANLWKDLIRDGSWRGSIYNKRKNGEVYLEVLTISSIYDNNGNIEYFLTIFSDVTAQNAKETELKKMAYYDGLTELSNRLMLDKNLEDAMEYVAKNKNTSLGLIVIDIDGFKPINELYGHQTGDEFLIKFANLLKSRLSSGQSLYRTSSDEFAILVSDMRDKGMIYKILENLMKITNLEITIDDRQLKIALSMGASIYSSDITIDKNSLIAQAQKALHKAKILGKNYYEVFEQNLDIFLDSTALCKAIKNGLQSDHFSILYQPIINVKTGLVAGFESFIRWQYGAEILSYERIGKFIANHTIYEEVALYNIKKVLVDEIRLSKDYGIDLKISIDIAFEVLYKDSFWEKFKIVALTNENIKKIEFNVQGLRDVRDYNLMEKVLLDYKQFGVDIILDDFSTSQNSLKILRDDRVKKVKVAEELALGVVSGADNLIMLRSALSICDMFSKTIIAKGVETSETMYFLIKAGYENLQGGFIGQKMPVTQIKKWFDEYGLPEQFKDIAKLDEYEIKYLSMAVMHRIWIRALLGMLSSLNYKNFKPAEFRKDYTALVVADYKKYITDADRVAIHEEITEIIMKILSGIENSEDIVDLIIDLKVKRDSLLKIE